jgi:citrate synthase
MLQTRVDSGLDGVIVADTVMSEVDGEEGRLVVRGHALQELVATRGYEGVACATAWPPLVSAPSPTCRSCWPQHRG